MTGEKALVDGESNSSSIVLASKQYHSDSHPSFPRIDYVAQGLLQSTQQSAKSLFLGSSFMSSQMDNSELFIPNFSELTSYDQDFPSEQNEFSEFQGKFLSKPYR